VNLPVFPPALLEPLAQLNQAPAFLAGLLEFLPHRFAFLVQRGPHFLVLPVGRLPLGLEGGAVLPCLLAQVEELLAALVEMGRQLFFLALQGLASLVQLVLFLNQARLLGGHRCCLDAQGIALRPQPRLRQGRFGRLVGRRQIEAELERPDSDDIAVSQEAVLNCLAVEEGARSAAQVAQLRRTVTKKGKKTVEVVYLITSDRDAGPATLAAWVRGHQEIENRLHWVRSPGTGLAVASCGTDVTRVSFSC